MSNKITCRKHGEAYEAFVCNHLVGASDVDWYSGTPTADNPWPDAWCAECHKAFLMEGEWNDASSQNLEATLICHHCYESFREKCTVHFV